MSSSADVDFRRLVEDAMRLADYSAGERRKDTHPLGFGISAGKSFPHPDGNFRLPAANGNFSHLEQTMRGSVLDLTAGSSEAAWNALLGYPRLVMPLAVPPEEKLLDLGIAISPGDREKLRSVALAVVLNQDVETIHNGILSSSRIAGAARLIVQLRSSSSGVSDDAWIFPSWSNTTRGFGANLEALVASSLNLARGKKSRRRAALVLDAEMPQLSEDFSVSMKMAAMVFGFELTIWNRSPEQFAPLRISLERHSPSLLVYFGVRDSGMDALVGTFKVANPAGQVIIQDTVGPTELLQAVRELFATIRGISPGLLPFRSLEAAVENRVILAPLPVGEVDACKHDQTSRFYVRDKVSRLWWTRDTFGHGGTVFKTYFQNGGSLIFEADRAADGSVVLNKHKGETGMVIPLSELHGCSAPSSHTE